MYGADGFKHGQDLREDLQSSKQENPRGNSWNDDCCCKYVCLK